MPVIVLQILVFVVAPLGVGLACKRSKILNTLSPIVLCYVVGIVIANQNFVEPDQRTSMTVCSVAVILAIPLLLFSVDLAAWLRLARPTLISCLLAFASALTVSTTAALAFHGRIEESTRIAGVLVGIYTGGTANMAAIATAVRLSPELLVMVNSADVLLGGLYFLFLISVGWRLFGKFLPETPTGQATPDAWTTTRESDPAMLRSGAVALLVAVAIVALSAIASIPLGESRREMVVILLVTTLALGASLHGRVRQLRGSYEVGQYFLFVFAVGIGATADFRELMNASGTVFLYTAVIFFGSIALHLVLCAWFRIDRDTTLITSTAAIYSPAFVPPVAEVLKNPQAMVSGVVCGLVGFAIGTYAGIGVASFVAYLSGG